MPELLIRDMPPELYERLKASAAKHNRSVSEEAIAFLEKALPQERQRREVKVPTPIKGKFPLTQEFLDKHKREGLP
ncbi:MAG: Arc family DNA-binding protein [Chloroflexi bacterium]|nr:Arc family DNA-binding protein [Chloroflexota bacterium]